MNKKQAEMPDYVADKMKDGGIPDDVAAGIFAMLIENDEPGGIVFENWLEDEIGSYLELQAFDFGEAAVAREDILAAATAQSPDDWTTRRHIVMDLVERFIELRDHAFDGAPSEYLEGLKVEAARLFPGRIYEQRDYIETAVSERAIAEMNMSAVAPQELSGDERTAFVRLVTLGGEVGGAVLATNIENARVLVMVRAAREIKGIAALKRPQASYRKRIGEKAGAEVGELRCPYELGYVYVLPEARGKGISHRLVAKALQHTDNRAVFATARADNEAMLATLTKAGFKQAGQDYRGRKNRMIRLLLRPASSIE